MTGPPGGVLLITLPRPSYHRSVSSGLPSTLPALPPLCTTLYTLVRYGRPCSSKAVPVLVVRSEDDGWLGTPLLPDTTTPSASNVWQAVCRPRLSSSQYMICRCVSADSFA